MKQTDSDKEKQYFTIPYLPLALSAHPRNRDTLPWSGISQHAMQINKIFKFCLERIFTLSAPLISVCLFSHFIGWKWLVLLGLQYCAHADLWRSRIRESKEPKAQTVIYMQTQQRRGSLQMISNNVAEWQEHIVFCSHSGVDILLILYQHVRLRQPVLYFFCFVASCCKLGV